MTDTPGRWHEGRARGCTRTGRPSRQCPSTRPASCARSVRTAPAPARARRLRARRKFDACEPENRLVGRTLERALEETLSALEREHGKLAQLERSRPVALSDHEREALTRLARDLPRLWAAPSTTDRDRKELLRTLISEVIVTANHDERRADIEVQWEGGARTELSVPLRVPGPLQQDRTADDTIELIRRLAEHHTDRQIAGILGGQGLRTGTGL